MSPPKSVTANNVPEPTQSELDILNVLWQLGPSTVRHVHAALLEHDELAYTTVLSMLQIMYQKGLVMRDDSERAHVYKPALSRNQTQRQILTKLLHRVFGGSTTELVMQALGSAQPASLSEINKIRTRLDELEGKRK
ncbi:MAG: BlaI/MecI/CopY family transcriptional regulator [Gammaproteobacteria bacterium]|nr:BlaI/MecI/CopY family transcriptional regulator [Gammaproteobacteria bacterium]MDE1888101.1 BlaI/MecI/CopY family transcriptional regulator [Gammaproteobacteria bacterium]MDE2024118.1 BlaI/MecI/CopY family transcriptional regulator [Gammaproteobacteria bacterium]MDE2273697.1 BlaI/MecI/CopY family transcriptional regulator [Gammaproteobacteria bacterium]